jgi:hypothetical protein
LELEAEAFEKETAATLNSDAKVIKLCARSKRWWFDDISKKRMEMGRKRHYWWAERVERGVYQEAKRTWQKTIREAKRKCCESFLEHTHRMDMWMAVRCTKTGRIVRVPTLIDTEGNRAEDAISQMQFLVDMAFLAPVAFQGGRGTPGPQVRAWREVNAEGVHQTIFSMSGMKSPGPDGISASAIHLLWERDADCVTTLFRTAIPLGAHPRTWKIAKDITILKPS